MKLAEQGKNTQKKQKLHIPCLEHGTMHPEVCRKAPRKLFVTFNLYDVTTPTIQQKIQIRNK